MTFSKHTTRAEFTAWIDACGCYKNEVKFLLGALSQGENRVGGEIEVANILHGLTTQNKWNVIRAEAIELGYKG